MTTHLIDYIRQQSLQCREPTAKGTRLHSEVQFGNFKLTRLRLGEENKQSELQLMAEVTSDLYVCAMLALL